LKFLKLFGNSDINRLVDMPSLSSYVTWLKETPKPLAPSTIVNKLRNVELAIEHVQCQYTDYDIENLENKCEKAIKWLKQRTKPYQKQIGKQRAENSIRGEENVNFAEDPAAFYKNEEKFKPCYRKLHIDKSITGSII